MASTLKLQGTVALVTGASRGIGEATARELAAHGAAIVLVARRVDRLEIIANEIRGSGATALGIQADVTQRVQAEVAVNRAVAELGRIDVLVNNAGVMRLGPIVDAAVEDWERMINLNMLGLFYCTRAALPYLLKSAECEPRRTADLVNVSSVAGRQVWSGSGVYNATKHAVGAFSESLRQEVTSRHVRVAVIEPGEVNTRMSGGNRPEPAQVAGADLDDLKKLEPRDIAEAIAYIVTRPRHAAVNELLIRPTEQRY